MHLLETYALATSSKIGKPYILEKFYPLPFDNYVVFAPYSKSAKNYDRYSDVLDILHPILKNQGMEIVQVGGPNELPLPNCYHTQGKTNINQVYNIVRNAKLYFGADTFVQHFASYIGVPSVILISNNHARNVRGYWNQDKQIILEPDRIKRKPSFSLDEGPNKQINEIKSEDIAKAVCQLLNIPFNFPYETLYVGENYTNKILESVPRAITNPQNINVDSLVLRMDYEFNEQVLAAQMQYIPATIVTNKPINLELLKNYKSRIKQIFYVVEKENSPEFVRAVQKLSIPISLFSYLSEEELNRFKLEYLDLALIVRREIKKKDAIKELKDVPVDKLYYKSSKSTLDSGKIFTSKAAWLVNRPTNHVNEIQPLIDSDETWKELEHIMILKKKD